MSGTVTVSANWRPERLTRVAWGNRECKSGVTHDGSWRGKTADGAGSGLHIIVTEHGEGSKMLSRRNGSAPNSFCGNRCRALTADAASALGARNLPTQSGKSRA